MARPSERRPQEERFRRLWQHGAVSEEQADSKRGNRLVNETSPYLRQHAYNPVDWYPWGEEALLRAKSEGRPILLSIGYAACHWCHVMERESFEDPDIAGLMNEKFVCIKVDREERPDIDSIYMDALQAMTGRGGWPMTMVLTPDAKPYFGGTYFPPADAHGMPSFRRVLLGAHDAWVNRKEDIKNQTEAILNQIGSQTPMVSEEPLRESLILGAVATLAKGCDLAYGGFGQAPKFPQAPALELLLRAAGSITPADELLHLTLAKMALGGIYDQIGGGFSRYTVDRAWLVPHFEKMLYDNAQLARVYTRAWQLKHDELYKRVSVETLDYLLREMHHVDGGFFASEDADSEGKEGKFYVWPYEEFMQLAPEAAHYYGVTPRGNFDGLNILTAQGADPPSESRQRLFEARSERVRPARDEKILTSWNGLAISALAEAGAVFRRPDFIRQAETCARFLLSEVCDSRGRLLHCFKDGAAKVLGMLEDYAYLAEALFTLWEATFDPNWLRECQILCRQMIELFSSADEPGFYSTGADHEQLLIRPKELIDGATPSPNGVASLVLQKIAVLTDDKELADRAMQVLRLAHAYMARAPQASGTLLCALDFWLSTPKEIVLLGEGAAAKDLAREVWERLIPNKVMAGARGDQDTVDPDFWLPMLAGKTMLGGLPTAFVCENYSCLTPATEPAELGRQLG